jgi:hypothetical protein
LEVGFWKIKIYEKFGHIVPIVQAGPGETLEVVFSDRLHFGRSGSGKLEVPKHLARTVHDLYFEPKYDEFRRRTIWILSNAFTSAFKQLDPIPQFKATAKLGEFLESRFSQSF